MIYHSDNSPVLITIIAKDTEIMLMLRHSHERSEKKG